MSGLREKEKWKMSECVSKRDKVIKISVLNASVVKCVRYKLGALSGLL